MLSCLKAVDGGVQLAVQVQPRASKTELIDIKDDRLRLRLTSPPVDGAANKLCRDFLAKVFGLSKSHVTLLAGERSRMKRWLLEGASVQQIEQTLSCYLDRTGGQ